MANRKGLLRGEIEAVKRRQDKTDREDPYRAVINAWLGLARENMVECSELIKENKMSKYRTNKFGESETGTYREGMSIPAGLFRALERFDPELFSDTPKGKKKRDWFRKHYPQFCRYAQ